MRFKKFCKDKRILGKILIIFSLVLIDLATKAFFANYFDANNATIEILWGFISFTFVKNTGAAYGMFSEGTVYFTIFSFLFIIIFVLMDVYKKEQTRLYTYAYTLIVAGALGNLIDRIAFSYVRDFIKFSLFDFVCNIADICITLGAILLIIEIILSVIKENKENKNDTRQDSN